LLFISKNTYGQTIPFESKINFVKIKKPNNGDIFDPYKRWAVKQNIKDDQNHGSNCSQPLIQVTENIFGNPLTYISPSLSVILTLIGPAKDGFSGIDNNANAALPMSSSSYDGSINHYIEVFEKHCGRGDCDYYNECDCIGAIVDGICYGGWAANDSKRSTLSKDFKFYDFPPDVENYFIEHGLGELLVIGNYKWTMPKVELTKSLNRVLCTDDQLTLSATPHGMNSSMVNYIWRYKLDGETTWSTEETTTSNVKTITDVSGWEGRVVLYEVAYKVGANGKYQYKWNLGDNGEVKSGSVSFSVLKKAPTLNIIGNFTVENAKCFEDPTGKITPKDINGGTGEYVITLKRQDEDNPINTEKYPFVFDGLRAGFHDMAIYNIEPAGTPVSGTEVSGFGTPKAQANKTIGCYNIVRGIYVGQPSRVRFITPVIATAKPHGSPYLTTCHNTDDGIITIQSTGGNRNQLHTYTITKPDLATLIYTSLGSDSLRSFTVTSLAGNGKTYTISVKDENQCTTPVNDSPTTVTITSPDSVILGLPVYNKRVERNEFDISCFNFNNGEVIFNPQGGWGTYRINISHNGSVVKDWSGYRSPLSFTGMPKIILADSRVQVWDEMGCTPGVQNNVLEIKEPPQLVVSPTIKSEYNHPGANISCNRLNGGYKPNGIITISGLGGIEARKYTFNLTKQGATEIITTTGSNYQNTSSGHSFRYELLTVGGYDFVIRDDNGCFANGSLNLTEPPLLFINDNISLTKPNCFDYIDGIAEITVTGGISQLYIQTISRLPNVRPLYDGYPTDDNHHVSRALMDFARTSTGFVFDSLPVGNYEFRTEDINKCFYTTFKRMSEPKILEAEIINGFALCYGDSNGILKLKPSGGTTPYRAYWTNNRVNHIQTSDYIGKGLTITGLAAGEYKPFLTDAHDCYNGSTSNMLTVPGEGSIKAASLLLTANVFPPPDSTLRITKTIVTPVSCFGKGNGVIDVKGGGGWSSIPTALNHVKGTPGYTYSTDKINFGSDGSLNSLTGRNYKIYLKDALGCIDSGQVFVPEPAVLTFSGYTKRDALCKDSANGQVTLSVTGGNLGYYYTLHKLVANNDPVSTLPITFPGFFKRGPGSYYITVEDNKACTATLSGINITEPPAIIIQFTPVEAACGKSNGGLFATVTGGTFPYTYHWKGNNYNKINSEKVSNIASITGIAADLYSLNIVDSNNCPKSGTTSISNQSGPQIVASVSKIPDCSYTHDGVVSLSLIKAGKGHLHYEWYSTEGDRVLLGTQTIVSGLPGNKSYIGFATDGDSCKHGMEVYLPAPTPLKTSIAERKDPICHNEANGQLTVSISGGTIPYEYTWNTNGEKQPSIGMAHSLPFSGEGRGGASLLAYQDSIQQKKYKVSIKDHHNCTTSDSATLYNPAKVIVDLGLDSALVCVGQVINLDARNEGKSYTWTGPNRFNSTTQKVAVHENGTYIIKVKNDKNCTALDTFKLHTSTNLLDAYFLSQSEPIEGDTVVMIEISWPTPDSIKWILPEELSVLAKEDPYIHIKAIKEGSYRMKLIAFAGICTDTLYKPINVLPNHKLRRELKSAVGYKGIRTIKAYPNPGKDFMNIEIQTADDSQIKISVKSLMGNEVYQIVGRTKRNSEYNALLLREGSGWGFSFDMSSWPPGVYILEALNDSGKKMIKLIKE